LNGKIGTLLTNNVSQRSKALGDRLVTTAKNLRAIGEQLRAGELTHGAADLADLGADKVEGIGQYLSGSNVETFLGDAEAFTRDNPWRVVLGGVALGLSASRVIKAGASRRGLRTTPAPPSMDFPSSKAGGTRVRA